MCSSLAEVRNRDMLALENDIQSENDLLPPNVLCMRSITLPSLGAGQAGCGSYAQLDGA